jgi:hypothetical protein
MKKASIMFVLSVLLLSHKANGQQSIKTSQLITMNQSVLVTGQEQGDKNVVFNDSFPVQLTAFLGQSTGNAIVLTWSTIAELNNKGFELERMEEGENQFVTVDFIEGSGTSINSISYEYIDAFAGNAYYRLKQINISGAYEFSRAIYVESSHIEKTISKLASNTVLVYPDPASSFINIEVKADEPTLFNVRVMDMMGKEFYCPVISKNISGKKITLGMDGLSKGMYLLVIQSGTTSIGKKIFLETN